MAWVLRMAGGDCFGGEERCVISVERFIAVWTLVGYREAGAGARAVFFEGLRPFGRTPTVNTAVAL